MATGKQQSAFTPAVLAMALLLLPFQYSRAQTPNEFDVKAVYIYNFVNFVEWPGISFNGAHDPFVIGVAGKNVFSNTLNEVVRNETYKGRPIEVRTLDNTDEALSCHIVFIEESCVFLDQILDSTKGKPVLTIGDRPDFLKKGGMIRFFLEDKKVKIEVNQTEATRDQLYISAKLLRLARIYKNK